ncbi:MAG: transcriptional repressor LexA [Christensenellales bacterium]|jgi:repressor LexA
MGTSSGGLSGQQQKVYQYIQECLAEKGYPPTVREICDAVGISSTSTAHGHLRRLEKRGLIKRDASRTRAISIVEEKFIARNNSISVPVIGKVTAGKPILAQENIEEYLPFPTSLIRDENSFILEVKGDSMIGAGIFDGDYIIIRRQDYADDGDIVVALIGEEATVKRFYLQMKTRTVRLQPENSSMEPILLPVNVVKIIGKVSGLFRKFR